MQYLGVSGFALLNKNFPVKRWLEQFPEKPKVKPAAAVLVGYFGKKAVNLKMFCSKFCFIKHLVELHLGFRDFSTTELLGLQPATRKKIAGKIKEAKRIMKVAGNANTKFIICPILEDTVTLQAWKILAREVRKELKLPLVRSTIGSSNGGGQYEEKHGNHPRFNRPLSKCIANPDGMSINWGGEIYDKAQQMSPVAAKSYRTKYAKCFAIFSWSADQQGLGGTTNWQKPPINKRKYVVTDAAIKGHQQVWFA